MSFIRLVRRKKLHDKVMHNSVIQITKEQTVLDLVHIACDLLSDTDEHQRAAQVFGGVGINLVENSRTANLSAFYDLSLNVYGLNSQLGLNYFEIILDSLEPNQPQHNFAIAPPSSNLKSAFEVLFQGQRNENCKQVETITNADTRDKQLFNACARHINSLGATFPVSKVQKGGIVFTVVKLMVDVIWHIDNQMQRFVLNAGGANCVPHFVYLMGQTEGHDGIASRLLWRDFVKQKIAPGKLSQEKLENFGGKVAECILFTCFNQPQWAGFREDWRQLASALIRVSEFLKRELASQQQFNSKVRNLEEMIQMSTTLLKPSSCISGAYDNVCAGLRGLEHFGFLCLSDIIPDLSGQYERYSWLEKVQIPCHALKLIQKRNATSPIISFLIKVPDDYSLAVDAYSTEVNKVLAQIRAQIPRIFNRAERKMLLHEIGFLMSYNCHTPAKRSLSRNYSKIEHHIVTLIMNDDSLEMNHISSEVRELVNFVADSDDMDFVLDMRRMGNHANSTKFDSFFKATRDLLEQEGFIAVDDRRHGTVSHLAASLGRPATQTNGHAPPFISIRHLKEKVLSLPNLPENIPVPSDSTLYLSFWPKNANHEVARRFSGKLNLRYACQSRQLHKWHPDGHYCAALFKYLRAFCVLYRAYCNLMLGDDKASVNIGEPEFPITAVPRNRTTIQCIGNTNQAGDHDFHRFKLTPSVFSVVQIPDAPAETFYKGQVYIGIKDAVFEASSALRYAAEQFKVASLEGVADHAIQASLFDGGPEHRLRNGSVKLAAICNFLKLGCDLLIIVNTAPNNSWTNPVERTLCIFNLAWGNLSLCRSVMPNADDEVSIKCCKSMKDLRARVQGDDNLKANVMASVAPCKEILLSRALQMDYAGNKVKASPVASTAEINEIWSEMSKIDAGLLKTMTSADVWKTHGDFYSWYLKHSRTSQYAFQLKNCGEFPNCKTCLQPKLPPTIFKDLHFLPEPEPDPKRPGSYKGFGDVYRSEQLNPNANVPTIKDGPVNVDGRGIFQLKNLKGRIICISCHKPRCIFGVGISARNWKLVCQLLSEQLHYVCGGELILDVQSEYHGKLQTNPTLTCEKHVEATYYRSKKFDPVCASCATSSSVIGITSDDVRRNAKQLILLPQCQSCVDNPNISDAACPYTTSKFIFRGFDRAVNQTIAQGNSLPALILPSGRKTMLSKGPCIDEVKAGSGSEVADEKKHTDQELLYNHLKLNSSHSAANIPEATQNLEDYKLLLNTVLHVPCSTWPEIDNNVEFFGPENYQKGYVSGEVVKATAKRFPTFTIRFESLNLVTNKQPLKYVLQYAHNLPEAFLQRCKKPCTVPSMSITPCPKLLSPGVIDCAELDPSVIVFLLETWNLNEKHHNDNNYILFTLGTIPFAIRQFSILLNDKAWLDDNHIELVGHLVNSRQAADICFFSPFLENKITTEQLDDAQTWIEKQLVRYNFLNIEGLFVDKLVVPVNWNKNHWILIILCRSDQMCYVADPYKQLVPGQLKLAQAIVHFFQSKLEYLADTPFNYKMDTLTDPLDKFLFPTQPLDGTTQDTWSCGVITCMNMFMLSMSKFRPAISFSEARCLLAYSIITGEVSKIEEYLSR